ncbi:MAG: hypothetical protein Q8N45_07480 [Anaerolineales bacterium]|nr:hypothetical protein [Anaerolineales bacterium]
MGAIFRWLRRLYNLLINATAVRYLSLPANVVGVTVTGAAGANAKGAYAEINDGTGITVESQIVGVIISPGMVDIYHVDLASGLGGAEVVLVANLPVELAVVVITAVGEYATAPSPIWLPTPIAIPAGTRLSARLATVGGGSDTATVAVILKQGY